MSKTGKSVARERRSPDDWIRRRLHWSGKGLEMGLRKFLKEAAVTLRLAAKPTRKEFMLSLKIAFIGIALVGVISYLIRFIALALQSF